MKLEINYKEKYSRGELLLRSFFGFFYIALPHSFVLMFLQIWSAILSFISFWSIVFTGRYPKSFFDFQVQLLRWNLRVNASLYNLIDDYPKFGLSASHPDVTLEVEYPEKLGRGHAIIKAMFGIFYVIIPHVFVLYFVSIGALFVMFINWWSVLFTGKISKSFQKFLVGFLRWSVRLSLYIMYMTDRYPPFSLDAVDQDISSESSTETAEETND